MSSHKMSVIEKIGYGSGDMAVNVVISSMMLIITFFYTDIFGLKPADVGILFLLVRLIDAITDPLMGIINDKVTTRWGRYRPYFLFMAIPFGLSVFLTFSTPDWDYNAKLIWAYSTYILVTIIFTTVTIPYISIISVLTDNPKERLSANGYRLFFAKIAAFLVTIIVPILASSWGGDDIAAGYQKAMGVMALMATLLFLFCFFTTTERVAYKVETKPISMQIRLLLKNDQWLILTAICVIGTIGYVIRGSVAAYYATYFLGGDAKMLSAFLSTGVGAAILAMVASTWITKRFCKLKLFRYSQIAVGILSVVMFFAVQPGDIVLAFVLYFAISFVVDLHAPVFWSVISESVDYGTVKTGHRVSGLAFGGISFAQKAGMGAAGFVVGMLLTYFNYQPGQEQTSTTLIGISLMLTIIPGAFHTLMGLLMFKYKISDRVYEDIKLSLPDMEVIDGKSTPETQPNVHKDSTQTQVSI
ncbi:MFS transporter [Shewanella putrefaciens]|uniref:Putative arabinoside GPH family transporter, AraT n=2 Tax=Shewanella putrefaciens TaxID=24 RepID=E6XKM6_SHEP2|nr:MULTISPECIES: MFS transporter [Shewanella]ABM24795.1 sugar (Glycoside-Pentoside-Hexuronide) transporter [Shewanella sp. W3-18-1]MCK7629300.1 MFS transporter [Shewanella sp. JNE9-1]MCK7634197.1 MFS transporter [Shewanella sp. JNE17]MCK7644370.1 MFS transporter [Shewanella sp. JNE3-1]MCK7649422.1 MFS transporter [Shewanella sp. JNE8]